MSPLLHRCCATDSARWRWRCRTGGPFEAYRLLDSSGPPVATGDHALLRWFRSLWATGVSLEQVTWIEARDFSRWVQVAAEPVR